MTRPRFGTPSPAMGVALVALFLALTGSVFAATKLSRNSVGTAQIKNGSIKGDDLADDTVTGAQIDESTLAVVARAATAGTATAAQVATTAQTARSADRATSAGTADRATAAGTADRASTADRATSAADADRVGGRAPSDFASASEVFTVAVKFAPGETKVLVDRGGVRLVGRCVGGVDTDQGGTANVFSIYAEAVVAGATLDSPRTQLDGSAADEWLRPDSSDDARLAVRHSANTDASRVWWDDSIVLTSAGGTTVFFGATAGIRVSLGLPGATCAVTAPVMVSTL